MPTTPVLDQQPFTLANLPYGVISTPDNERPRCAVAIGEHAVDLTAYAQEGRLDGLEGGVEFGRVFEQVREVLFVFGSVELSLRTEEALRGNLRRC